MPPTREQILANMQGLTPEQQRQYLSEVEKRMSPSAGSTLSKVEDISPTPWYQRDILPSVASLTGGGDAMRWIEEKTGFEGVSPEGFAEGLPAATATAASMATTKNPALTAAAASGAGEAGRQLFRRAIGVPAATGNVQRAFDLDPESAGAAVAGIAGEGLTGLIGGLLSKVLNGTATAADKSALRSINNLVQTTKKKDLARWKPLAQRTRTEGISSPALTRATTVRRAEEALKDASSKLSNLEEEAISSGRTISTEDLLREAEGLRPQRLPTGDLPATAASAERSAGRAIGDIRKVAEAYPEGVPMEAALAERRRLDTLIKRFYEGGADMPPESKAAAKGAADIYRRLINADPSLAEANLRKSELLALNRLLKTAAEKSEREGFLGPAGAEASAAAAGAVGRMSIPAMLAGRAGIASAPVTTISSTLKSALSKILRAGGDSAQAWIRLGELFGDTADIDELELRRRAERELRQAGEGVVGP